MTMRTNSISNEQEKKLKEAFALFDRLGGGVISVKDLGFVISSIGYQATPSEIEQMIKQVDRDGNGLIDFNEFKQMMKHRENTLSEIFNDDLLNEAFRIFDKDGNGFISKIEIHSVMSNLGEQLTDDEINAMINEADLDGNREVDYGEFRALVRRLLTIQHHSTANLITHNDSKAYEGQGIIPFIDEDLEEENI